ncbi:flavin reductase [Pseudarthrobacter sp. B4EP4b]|uniref:flavin reductase n=1 Tax=Pseudarthrobacter sp. B4EP4b TaxID=2590664 RepID=UPI00115348C6|nr:flavin reductase [Pseudarthrobacter sp. B4EP4b]
MSSPDDLKGSFRDAMANLSSAVCVITSSGVAGRLGFTATAVSSVTDDPPMLLVCMNQSSMQNKPLLRNGVLCVNVLSASQQPLASVFAGSVNSLDERFAAAEWTPGETGSPLLECAVANVDCAIHEVINVGTHTVIFAEVMQVRMQGGHGLVYFNRSYHHVGTANSRLEAQIR